MFFGRSCKNALIRRVVSGLWGKIKNAHIKVATFTLEVRFPTSQRPFIGLNPLPERF
jgi:hypothetical protein